MDKTVKLCNPCFKRKRQVFAVETRVLVGIDGKREEIDVCKACDRKLARVLAQFATPHSPVPLGRQRRARGQAALAVLSFVAKGPQTVKQIVEGAHVAGNFVHTLHAEGCLRKTGKPGTHAPYELTAKGRKRLEVAS